MKRILFTILLVLLMVTTAEGTRIRLTNDMIGGFSGDGGNAQDDSVKSSLDLLHSKISGEGIGTGNEFYVDSAATGLANGTSWTDAVVTVQAGVDLCTANRGDVVHVAQNHEENIASAAALDADCAGITIIGHGNGEDMPQLSLTANLSTIQVSAADVWWYNIRFLSAKSGGGVVQGVDVTADGDGFGFFNCEWRETSNDYEFTTMLTITADADEGLIIGNRFLGETGGSDANAIAFEGGSDKTVIQGNYFHGDWSDYVIDATKAASYHVYIKGNTIHNFDTGAGKTVKFHASSTGDIVGSNFYGNGATFAIAADAMFISPDNVVTNQENVETATYFDMLGAFTGPAAGTAQDDNVKAAVDIAIVDLGEIEVECNDIDANTILILADTDEIEVDVNACLVDLGEIEVECNDIDANTILILGDTDEIEVDVNAVLQDLAEIEVECNDIDANTMAIYSDTTDIDANIAVLQLDLDEIEVDCNSIYSDTTDIDANLAVAQTDLDEIEADVNAVLTDTDEIEVDVNNIYSDTSDIDANMTAVLLDLAEIEVECNDIDANTIAILTDTDEIEVDVNAILLDTDEIEVECNDIDANTIAILADTGEIEVDVNTILLVMERCLEQATCVPAAGDVTLFNITGGPILVTDFAGIVTTIIGDTVATCQIQLDVTTPANTINMSTAVAITSDAAGCSYTFTAASPSVLTPTDNGGLDQLPLNRWFCPIGSLVANFSATNTGNIKWYMSYKPLSPNSVVAAP